MTAKRVFSGIQPTGSLHLGNLVGALDNWRKMQADYECFYCVVDLHALTIPMNQTEFKQSRLETAKGVLAAGIDPDRSRFYFQSQVPQHAELAWILGTITGVGQLQRMTQFKEKGDKAGQNLGLFGYPVLMAADILVHKVHAVPVGEDQMQHLELTRDIAERFNHRYRDEFPLPDRITPQLGARVMSLQDPQAKMSKSDPDPRSRILMFEQPDEISAKIKVAVTDSERYVEYDWEHKPGISNLLELMSFFSGTEIGKLVEEYHSSGYGTFKQAVAESIAEGLSPIRRSYQQLQDGDVVRILERGALDARHQAEQTMVSVRQAVGLGNL